MAVGPIFVATVELETPNFSINLLGKLLSSWISASRNGLPVTADNPSILKALPALKISFRSYSFIFLRNDTLLLHILNPDIFILK